MSLRSTFTDIRLWLLLAALLLALATFLVPRWPMRQPVYSTLFVVDITRSMNVADYRVAGESVTRLERAKQAVAQAVSRLPCGSRAGLALFTERTINITLMPVEVCGSFNSLQASIEQIDWRMAWAADSNINRGLYYGIQLVRDLRGQPAVDERTALVLLTDGHEAPPVNPRYEPDPAELVPGKKPDALGAPPPDAPPLHGVLVGVGGYEPAPIPKFNAQGERIGVYGPDDVQQSSKFGQPKNPEEIEGYVPRNAPWGRHKKTGSEHLSAVRESHLQSLAAKAGFEYLHLEDHAALYQALTPTDWADLRMRRTDIRWLPAAAALSALILVYVLTIFGDLQRARLFTAHKSRVSRKERSN
ncbi:vWA domain-containing protein [Thiohalorhabdus sp. Cl-TMA]|uniref:VWA domain-containing protein n=1 Tax=Thiohalorhabdus methylotrophus TaxID=3242694 RepID=A0ABV4TZ39_9GAMM